MSYKDLKSFQPTSVIYDCTVEFCDRYVDKKSRTIDQMTQAARSGKQNIAEGCAQSMNKPKSEHYLLCIASASLKELLEDYEDFLRQRGLRKWEKDDPRAVEVRRIPYRSDKSDKSNMEDRSGWSYKTYTTYKTYLGDPEQAANAMITLINQTTYLLDQQIKAVERQMEGKGISSESHGQKLRRIMQEEKKKSEEFDAYLLKIVDDAKNKSDKTDMTNTSYTTYASDGSDSDKAQQGFISRKALWIGALMLALMIGGSFLFGQLQSRKSSVESKLVFNNSSPIVIPLGIPVVLAAESHLIQESVHVTGSNGNPLDLFFDVAIDAQQNQLSLAVTQKKNILKPGRYTVSGTVETAEGVRDFSQDFYWGVLAMNFNKSVYRAGEEGYIQMAVLDDQGNTLCNSRLELQIRNPKSEIRNYYTEDAGIVQNPACGPNNVIDTPDYSAQYVFSEAGTYQFELTAFTDNGARVIKDFVEVRDSVEFDVERTGPTRIWPRADYEMSIRVKPQQDFQGVVEERMPKSFKIPNPKSQIPNKFKIQESNDLNVMSWEVSWKAGETYELSYTFDAPNVSPEFFLLGPLVFRQPFDKAQGDIVQNDREVFRESRQWQIASDAEATIDSAVFGSQAAHKEQSTVVFISDQVGYVFYADADGACDFIKTTNGGATWGSGATVSTGNCVSIAVWYDRWTPGDTTGNYIHIAFTESSSDDVYYERLNTEDDTQMVEIAVNTASTNLAVADVIAITKATDGELFIGLTDNTSGTSEKVMSCTSGCDTGGNWGNNGTSPFDDASNDPIILMPLASGDVMAIRTDVSAEDIQSNIWNGSSWAGWVTIDSNAPDNSAVDRSESLSATVNRSTNDVYLVYGSDIGTNDTGEIRSAVYSGGSWTAKTDVIADTELGASESITTTSISRDENTGDLYVAYLRGAAGTSMNAFYKKSTDGMANWNVETQFNTTNSDLYYVKLNLMSSDRIYGTYLQDTGATDDGLYGNTVVNLLAQSSATDTPDPTNPNRSVSFIIDWYGGASVKGKACKTNSLTNQNCDGGFWATSTAFTTTDPLTIVYDVTVSEHGTTQNYYSFLCDVNGDCTSGFSGTFSVNAVSNVPDASIRGGQIRGGVKVR